MSRATSVTNSNSNDDDSNNSSSSSTGISSATPTSSGHASAVSKAEPSSALATPTRAPAAEEGDGEERKRSSSVRGMFPIECAQGTLKGILPEEVLQTLLSWLRASDLSALCGSSKAAVSPGERCFGVLSRRRMMS